MKTRISFKDYLMFLEAWFFLAFSRMLLFVIPFRRIVPILKDHKEMLPKNPLEIRFLYRMQVAIGRASVRSPWRAKCFEQALAAKLMLKRRGVASTIYFGVYKPDEAKQIKAHAWLECQGSVVTGRDDLTKYDLVHAF